MTRPYVASRSGEPLHRLTPPDAKKALLRAAGADCVVTANVDETFLSLSPEAFVRDVIFGRFAPRCGFAVGACHSGTPPLVEQEAGHAVACIRAREIAA